MQKSTERYEKTIQFIKDHFYAEYLEGLKEFVRIPSLAFEYDKDWLINRNLFKQLDHLTNFAKAQNLKNCKITPLADEGYSPFLIVEVEASNPHNQNSVLLYGHMDKQPFGDGWKTDPCDPVMFNIILQSKMVNFMEEDLQMMDTRSFLQCQPLKLAKKMVLIIQDV